MNIGDAPTIVLPTLPPSLSQPGTAPLRLRAALAAYKATHGSQATPVDPLVEAMQQLFMSTMNYFHWHSETAMSHDLINNALIPLQRTMHDPDASAESRKAILLVAIHKVQTSFAYRDTAVRRALWQARDVAQPDTRESIATAAAKASAEAYLRQEAARPTPLAANYVAWLIAGDIGLALYDAGYSYDALDIELRKRIARQALRDMHYPGSEVTR